MTLTLTEQYMEDIHYMEDIFMIYILLYYLYHTTHNTMQ